MIEEPQTIVNSYCVHLSSQNLFVIEESRMIVNSYCVHLSSQNLFVQSGSLNEQYEQEEDMAKEKSAVLHTLEQYSYDHFRYAQL